MQKNFVQIKVNVEKFLFKLVGKSDSHYILNILGTGESFLKTICLLPFWFSASFYSGKRLKNKDLNILGEANFKAWIAYTLYDYLRDGKILKDKIVMAISVANICSHTSLVSFHQFTKSKFKANYILNLFNTIDSFYISEQKNTNLKKDFKKYCRKISDKSIAAAITPILIVPENKHEKENVNHIVSFFKFYFKARQLSDDLDDYRKDMRLKIKTPATLLLEQGFSIIEMKEEMRKEIDLSLKLARKKIKKIVFFDFKTFGSIFIKAC